ncbi:amino acid permease [Aquibacillus albus]|uniref:L-asparagine transporter-like permease n=1 Tax=Aquibacillus albus TaxID=1168171 RepID=A0ABS2MZ70_9BACI|nr:amino acid permease [Aquibacillus albus]MBM7571174.1 L-asparagine transporter-like permease [Aquibacillus albus]
MANKQESASDKHLSWWQLSLVGIGSIIGTGFFLGSSIAFKQAGPSAIFAFLLAALSTYIVFDSLAKMTAKHPEQGSFRSYAKKAFGRWAGFSNGWVYWSSELLIMGSQLTALGLFSKFWFPNIELWIFASIYGVLGIIVLLTGISGFEKFENVSAVVKVAAILMFIIIATLAIFGVLDGKAPDRSFALHYGDIFPNGWLGFWTAMIYAFYAFGGIEVMGIMANDLKDPKQAPKAGSAMLFTLATIYVLSLALAVYLVPWNKFTTEDSPFITALAGYQLNFVPHLFNGALVIAGFSTMVASLYAITTILVTLSKDGDAPGFFSRTSKHNIPFRALGLTVTGLVISIVVSLLVPDKIFEYFTTAAGLMLLYTWLFILFSFGKLIKSHAFGHLKQWVGVLLIIAAVSGTLFDKSSRPGFFVSLAFLVLIALVTYMMRNKWKGKEEKHGPTSLFKKHEDV